MIEPATIQADTFERDLTAILADLEREFSAMAQAESDPLAGLAAYLEEWERQAKILDDAKAAILARPFSGDVIDLDAIRASRRRAFRVPNCKAGRLEPADLEPVLNIRAFKVGGLRFLRVGEFQLSFCRTRKPIRKG